MNKWGSGERDLPLGSVGRDAGISCLFSVNIKSSGTGCKKQSATLPGLFLAMPRPCLTESTPVTTTVPIQPSSNGALAGALAES